MGCFYSWQGDDLLLKVKTQPNASKDEFCDVMGDRIKIRISAPPAEGKANKHLLRFLAETFGLPSSRVTLLNGASSRDKRFRIIQPEKLPAFINPSSISKK